MLIGCPPQRDVSILLERVSYAFLCGGADGVNGAAKEAFGADNFGPRRLLALASSQQQSLKKKITFTSFSSDGWHLFISSVVSWSKEGWIRRSSHGRGPFHQNHCFHSVGPKPEDGDSGTISVLSRINKRQSTASEAESTKDGVKLGEERKVSYSSCVSSFFRGRKLI